MEPDKGAAVEVVEKYYAAIEAKDAEGMLALVHEAVQCEFLEPERNWHGKETALGKFTGWFQRCPDLRVSWSLDSVKQATGSADPQAIEVLLDCDFGSGTHKLDSTNRLITLIQHL
eukprot:CAMPEP_0179205174 /NCGR_PEP_ID=MMETSP0796-20121207/102285_1 /TAXON_ID=73915 /ORGANISM="Pyrodinium bahamense, Strain pbaha01" /LENGTH=115 /DNA_ID=CAMNT_0020910059 /DNA_START=91 /DNA_END=438 /DNA_ORIENTATION=-